MSSWVNSGWRSARRSSSRMQSSELEIPVEARHHARAACRAAVTAAARRSCRDTAGSGRGSRAPPPGSPGSSSASRSPESRSRPSRGAARAQNLARARRLRCRRARRRSRYRWRRRSCSSTSVSSLTGNGGVLATASTVHALARSSTSPVSRLGLTFSGRAQPDLALDAQHPLEAGFVSGPVGLGRFVGVDHHLEDSGVVAKVDEDETAVVTPAVHPAERGRSLPRVRPRAAYRNRCGQCSFAFLRECG